MLLGGISCEARGVSRRGDAKPVHLGREWATYVAKLPELQINSGRFVLIHGDDVAGIFDTYLDAVKAGYERFQLEPFLVKSSRKPSNSRASSLLSLIRVHGGHSRRVKAQRPGYDGAKVSAARKHEKRDG